MRGGGNGGLPVLGDGVRSQNPGGILGGVSSRGSPPLPPPSPLPPLPPARAPLHGGLRSWGAPPAVLGGGSAPGSRWGRGALEGGEGNQKNPEPVSQRLCSGRKLRPRSPVPPSPSTPSPTPRVTPPGRAEPPSPKFGFCAPTPKKFGSLGLFFGSFRGSEFSDAPWGRSGRGRGSSGSVAQEPDPDRDEKSPKKSQKGEGASPPSPLHPPETPPKIAVRDFPIFPVFNPKK